MLHIKVPAAEFYDESIEEFVKIEEQNLVMEHSLISISKWEAKWKKPYMSDDPKTAEEVLDYIKCMTIKPSNVNPLVYKALSSENLKSIYDYIQDPMTATTISEPKSRIGRREVLTSELIYYYMIAQNIPIELEKWHINRLIMLIRVCSIKNNPNEKKMSASAIMKQNRALNAARKAKYRTRG